MRTQQRPGTPIDERALLAESFELAPSFIALLTGSDHVFELINPAYSRLIGGRDVVGKPIRVALPELVGQGFVALLDRVYRSGEPFIGNEVKVLLQSGAQRRLVERSVNFVYQARRNADGDISGIFVHGVDVTDLVRARQQSDEQAQRITQQAQAFDQLITNITDFIYTFDRAGRFTFANKPLLDLLGITLPQIVGRNFHELPYPEDLANTLQAYIQRVIDTKEQIVDETPYVSPSGKSGYYEYIFSPVFDEAGEVVLVAGSTRDITERVLREREKDQFLAIVSHELKTPVTSIKAYAQILQRRLTREDNTAGAAQMAKMNAQIDKLSALIADLLDITRAESGKLQFHQADFAFDSAVAEAIEEVQRTTKGHRIELRGATNRVVHGDKDRIEQVVVNLLTNAVKFSPHADRIAVTLNADDARVTLSVRDFGIGIPAEQQSRIFERFYRAVEGERETVPGLGLGLFIAAEIVERHAGVIWAESDYGHGATFSFSLPAAAPHNAQAFHSASPSQPRNA